MQPGQQKISQFDPVTSTQSGDIIPLVRNGQNKRITVDQFSGVVPDGFVAAAQIWTFSSWNSTTRLGVITVPTDATTKYSVDMRVRITQATGGTKYARIIAVTSTTLTVFMLNATTLNNETISTPMYSSLFAPYAPATVNWQEQQPWVNVSLTNGVVTTSPGYFKDSNGVVHLRGQINLTGNLTIFTLPAGYRPEQYKEYGTSSAGQFSVFSINTSGNITRITGNNGNLDIDLVSFRAA